MMPHKIYEEEKFAAKAAELKGRFSLGKEGSLFKSRASNVPMDGLSIYMENTWGVIRS
jgi:hypothetical protein